MPPAFILSQDQTLHELPSCITYSFLVSRQSWFGIWFHLLNLNLISVTELRRHNLTCIHGLTIRPELPPINIIWPYPPLCQLPILLSTQIGSRPQNGKIDIGFRDNQVRTDDFHHVKVTLYRWVIPLPLSLIEKKDWLILSQKVEKFNATIFFFNLNGPPWNTLSWMGKIRFNCQLLRSEIGLTMDLRNIIWFHKTIGFSGSK